MLSFSNVDLASPLSLYSIPVVWFTSFYPHTWKFLTIDKTVGFDNLQPRSNSKDARLPRDVAARVGRMEGAHLNGNEVLPLWIAAILAGNLAGLDSRWMNKMAISFIGVRILFNHVYVDWNKLGNGWVRTGIFFFSISYPLRILVKAAAKVARH